MTRIKPKKTLEMLVPEVKQVLSKSREPRFVFGSFQA
jgi:hypothetical protein